LYPVLGCFIAVVLLERLSREASSGGCALVQHGSLERIACYAPRRQHD
jgi:hypothetical protein